MKKKTASRVITETKYGKIKGIVEDNICKWRGIPYAEAPVGDLRFRRSVYKESCGNKTLNAENYGPNCLQTRKRNECDEDSLTLNIWSKKDSFHKPVLFYIHGGSFANGSGSDLEYEGSILAQEEVVVVTINYRLGILGMSDFSFLSERFETNCGLSDILCALKWVKYNIADFGGDPNNITVMGQSAGAIAVSALLVIPEAQSYISKAIMLSGSPTLMHTKSKCEHLSQEFMIYSGIETPKELLAADAQILTDFQLGFSKRCGLGEGTFAIEIDGDYLSEFPIPAIKQGMGRDIPLLIGSTREEMSFVFVKPFDKMFDIGGIFQAGVEGEDKAETLKIDQAYNKFGKRKHAILLSDLVFRIPSVWFAEEYSNVAPTWMYRFDYESFIMRATGLHSFHYTDLPMIFGNTKAWLFPYIYPTASFSKSFKKISGEMREDILKFIRTGVLDWQKCSGESTPAKCYNKKTRISPIVDKDIKEVYLNSNFYKRSLKGESNNLK